MKSLFTRLKNRWNGTAGHYEILAVAFPLILSTGSWSIKLFADRMFLTWYSADAIAASVPAAIVNFTFISFFMGTAGYVNTFVAQYFGAEKFHRIGVSVWHGIFFAALGGVLIALLAPFSETIFRIVGHAQGVQAQEVAYFRILTIGSIPPLLAMAMGGFYTGRSKNWPVMWVNSISAVINIILDYLIIFGNYGFPEMGIRGAAYATVISSGFSVIAFAVLIFRPAMNRKYHTLKGFRFEKELFLRLLRYGLPNGVQFFIDVAGFSIFVLLLGRLGQVPLAASNITFNINTLAFMPLVGLGIAVSVKVGQYLGQNRPDLAQKSVYSAFQLCFLYIIPIVASYLIFPDLYLSAFAAKAAPGSFDEIRKVTLTLLRFVAAFSVFDIVNIVFSNGIRGAGDTKYIMRIITIFSIFVMVIPTYIVIEILQWNLYASWSFFLLNTILLGLAFWLRFVKGKWKTMRVIEMDVTPLADE